MSLHCAVLHKHTYSARALERNNDHVNKSTSRVEGQPPKVVADPDDPCSLRNLAKEVERYGSVLAGSEHHSNCCITPRCRFTGKPVADEVEPTQQCISTAAIDEQLNTEY